MRQLKDIAHSPWLGNPVLQRVMAVLAADGPAARCVGGAVRDGLLGIAGTKDFDLATPLLPERVLDLLLASGIKAWPQDLAHGTVAALMDGDLKVEVTTLRRDLSGDGRHAVVAFGESWAEDSARRDLTINAIYCDAAGCLYDPQGGINDLVQGRVRFIGHARERLTEDYLRILRFFRFHARFSLGAMDEEALAAVKWAAPELRRLSGERIAAELLAILPLPTAAATFEVMERQGICAAILPPCRPKALIGAQELAADGVEAAADPLLRLALLLAPETTLLAPEATLLAPGATLLAPEATLLAPEVTVGPQSAAQHVAARLRLSKKDRRRLERLWTASALETWPRDDVGLKAWLYRLGAHIFFERALVSWCRLECTARKQWRGWLDALGERAAHWQPQPLPLRGSDVRAAGVAPGPAIGRILRALEAWWLAAGQPQERENLLIKLAELIADEAKRESSGEDG